MDYNYIKRYKPEDIELESGKKYVIRQCLMIAIVGIGLSMLYNKIDESKQFWAVLVLSLMAILLKLDSQYWLIKSENDVLFIKLGLTKCRIPFKDLIDIKMITRVGGRVPRRTYKIIRITYKKDERMKQLELFLNKNSPVNEVIKFIDKFSEYRIDDTYLDIRTQEEEKELEKILGKALWTNDIRYVEPKKLMIIVISTVVITTGIILYFWLIPRIIECNNY